MTKTKPFIIFQEIIICFAFVIVIKWIESYLANRYQKTKIHDVISDDFQVPFEVPQGSRLGPLLFDSVHC